MYFDVKGCRVEQVKREKKYQISINLSVKTILRQAKHRIRSHISHLDIDTALTNLNSVIEL